MGVVGLSTPPATLRFRTEQLGQACDRRGDAPRLVQRQAVASR